MKKRAGKTVQNLSGDMAYASFYPQPLPPEPNIEIDVEMRQLLIDAHKKLALLNGLSDRIPNKDLFISMYVRKEALGCADSLAAEYHESVCVHRTESDYRNGSAPIVIRSCPVMDHIPAVFD